MTPSTNTGKLKRCHDCDHTKAAHTGESGECMAPLFDDDKICNCDTFNHGTKTDRTARGETTYNQRGQTDFDQHNYIGWNQRQDEDEDDPW